jgi:cytochrome c
MRRLIPLVMLAPLAACAGNGGHDQAKALIATHCATCHTVPGVAGAVGKVGPSLAGVASRQFIAGKFANNRATLVRWIMHPQAMMPGVAMPEMGITQPEAMAIADYLSTLDKP